MTTIFLISMPSTGEWITLFIFLFTISGIFLIPYIFYLLTLSNTLKQLQVRNQKIPPGNVWLLFIPVFNLIWHFIVVIRISESLEAEYRDKNISISNRPTYSIGIHSAY
jgi:hypothetical protein